ncbi:Do family serine endopeptidase [Helicobacter trogontum]|uniref:Do family serine endopeptidase n=1 Tax=Helicobacter trogontum TaxID=50960 RepID=A0A4U8T5Q7_9HELI|nr:Do family serine endopeptidase [Helicobacter trogontum]MCI5785829.1 Do family serine endopeptidase [Helicobacter trogontum]MDY5184373.1 Do family serine endopeptidase [Helicobacter trogontum]TLD94906.1 Do family serine endopeptidase [Helicobacter trogontum]
MKKISHYTLVKMFAVMPLSFCLGYGFNVTDAPSFTRSMPSSKSNVVFSYHEAIKDATKAVVNITTERKVGGGNSPFNDPFFQQFFGDMVPQDKLQGGIGSGVIITNNGYIVTNSHVIKEADKIYVTLPGDTKKYAAKLIGEDSQSDIAVIKIDANNLPILPFADSSRYAVGDVVFAIGNPFGVGESVTQGIISALNKNGFGISNYENFIQTDASINPGNSGGALIDSRGAFIGMNTAIISRTGGNHGIGFAIPSEMVKSVATELIKSGKVRRGFLGVSIKDLDSDIASTYGDAHGALVVGMQANSPAQKAGLAVWDLITAVNGKPIKGAAELRNLIGSIPPNQSITLTLIRNNIQGSKASLETKQVKVVLAEQPQNISTTNQPNKVTPSDGAFDGLSIDNLTAQVRQVYRVPNDINGALVSNVQQNSKAQELGFQKGDVISQIENMPIKNTSDFQNALRIYSGKPKRILIFNIMNNEVKTIVAQ